MTLFRVESGARTHDTRNHNPMLCQLSYDHHIFGGPKGLRPTLIFRKRVQRYCFFLKYANFFHFFCKKFLYMVKKSYLCGLFVYVRMHMPANAHENKYRIIYTHV